MYPESGRKELVQGGGGEEVKGEGIPDISKVCISMSSLHLKHILNNILYYGFAMLRK